MRSLRLVHPGLGRFWEAHRDGGEVELTQGALGTAGRTAARSFPSSREAEGWVDEQATRKRNEGFVELLEVAGPAAPVAADPALLEKLVRTPDDDGLRLVYADQLTSAGDPHGEFITVQVELARLDPADPRAPVLRHRERELLERFRGRWSQGLRAVAFEFHRGFATEARVALEDLAAVAPRLFTVAPLLRRVTVTGETWWRGEAGVRLLLSQPGAARLEGLTLNNGPPTLAVPVLEASGLAGLVHLALRRLSLRDEEAMAVLSAPHLAGLRSVELKGNQVAGRTLGVLASRPLTALGLSSNRLGQSSINLLAKAPALGGVTTLELDHNGIGDVGLRVLGAGTWWTEVKSLGLADVGATATGVAALVAGAITSRLESLDLSRNAVGARGVEALARSSLTALRSLELSDAMLGDEGLARLAEAPLLAQLEHLGLRRNGLTWPAVERLLGQAGRLGRLRSLTLSGNPLSPEVSAAVKAALPGVHVVLRPGEGTRGSGVRPA